MVKRAFSLLELLIVVAVFSLLVAILFPVFAQTRAKARQTTCSSQLSQIVQAGLMYVQDYDERFPSCYWLKAAPYAVDPRYSLQPYLKNWRVLYCPERFTWSDDCLDPITNHWGARCMGYGYNWGSNPTWLGIRGDGLIREVDGVGIGVFLSEVPTPAHTFFYGDTNDVLFLTLLRDLMPGATPETRKELSFPVVITTEPPRHSGGNLFAFCDGHIQ